MGDMSQETSRHEDGRDAVTEEHGVAVTTVARGRPIGTDRAWARSGQEVDWVTLCAKLNRCCAEFQSKRERPIVRVRNDAELAELLRELGYVFVEDSLLELPAFVRKTLANLANSTRATLGLVTDMLIQTGTFDATILDADA